MDDPMGTPYGDDDGDEPPDGAILSVLVWSKTTDVGFRNGTEI
jgi:hypothetical protein